MRLICPNCDAQYEVADDVIPMDGRDVQCSSCGETWYQLHPDHLPAPAPDPDAPDDMAPPDEDEKPTSDTEPTRRALDPTVADILRQEAALESKARAEAAEALESQPELGLEPGTQSAGAQKPDQPDAASKPAPSPEPPPKPQAFGARRDLLPDIEEINSTLRSTSDRQSDTAAPGTANTDPMPQGASGFGRGFMLMILLAVFLGAIYGFAPAIAQAMPQADPYLSAYVAQVDTARSWLDGQVADALTWLDSVATAQTSE